MSTATVTCASISGAARGTKAAEEFKIDPARRFRLIAEPVLPLTGDTLMSEVKRNVWTEVLPGRFNPHEHHPIPGGVAAAKGVILSGEFEHGPL